MKSKVLSTRVLNCSHTGEVIASELRTVLKEWDISVKYPTLVTDQGSNVVKAAKILRWNHLACFAHKLNLCLTAYGLDKVPDCSKLVKKCQTLAVYCRRRRNQFSQKQEELRSFYDNCITSDHTYFKQLDVPNTSVKINV